MNEATLRALVEAGAVRKVRIIGNGSLFHVEADTSSATVTAMTRMGSARTWRTLDAAARWVRKLGMGTVQVELSRWTPGQKGLTLR